MCLKCDSVVSGCQKLLQMQALGRSRSLGTPEGGVAGVGKAGWHGHERLKAVDLAAEEIAVHQAIQAHPAVPDRPTSVLRATCCEQAHAAQLDESTERCTTSGPPHEQQAREVAKNGKDRLPDGRLDC